MSDINSDNIPDLLSAFTSDLTWDLTPTGTTNRQWLVWFLIQILFTKDYLSVEPRLKGHKSYLVGECDLL